MSAEAHYFRVGLFVLLGVALAGSCTVVLGGGDLFQETERFETYFNESVQGLGVGSPVMLRGVPIGRVVSIGFVTEFYDVEDVIKWDNTVSVLFEVVGQVGDELDTAEEREERLLAFIDRGLRLRLSTNPLTGASFLQSDFLDPQRFPPMEIDWGPTAPRCASAPSRSPSAGIAGDRGSRTAGRRRRSADSCSGASAGPDR